MNRLRNLLPLLLAALCLMEGVMSIGAIDRCGLDTEWTLRPALLEWAAPYPAGADAAPVRTVALLAALGCLASALWLCQIWRFNRSERAGALAESALRQNGAGWRAMAEAASELLVQADPSGQILRSNRPVPVAAMVPLFETPEPWARMLETLRAGETPPPCEVRLASVAGGRPMDWRVLPVIDASGKLTRIDSAFVEIGAPRRDRERSAELDRSVPSGVISNSNGEARVDAPLGGPPKQTSGLSSGEAPSVLIVEDNLVNQRVAVRLIEKMGYQAAVACNGREAIHAVGRKRYDLILMDCQMPEMDGFNATAEIRRLEPPSARIPIIAMTANAMFGDRERCLAAGMDDYLSKPVGFEELHMVVERWLARTAGTARV